MQAIRPFVLALIALLSGAGFISPEVAAVLEANAVPIIAGGSALWAVIAFLRNRKEDA